MTKSKILKRINRTQTYFEAKWEDVVDDLDLGIEEINHWMGTKYPKVSEVLDDFADPNKTYSYRDSGKDVPYFPNKYFMNIVIPYAVMQLLAYEEEFSTIYSKYKQDIEENLLKMVADELHHVPHFLVDSPKGVYFQNPNPLFKENPEEYFNRKILVSDPKVRVYYDWNIGETNGFVDKPLPVDNNNYEKGTQYMPSVMGTNNYIPYLVDEKGMVLAFFVGWSFSKNKEDLVPTGYITLEEDITLYGVWNFDIIRFKYDGNGGTLSNWQPLYINVEEYLKNQSAITPYAGKASRKGYKFLGFEPESFEEDLDRILSGEIFDDGIIDENELEFIQTISEEKTFDFKARWAKEFYRIRFVGLDENNFIKPNNIIYTYGTNIILPDVTTREGSTETFLGWYDNSQFLGNAVLEIFESDLGDKTFYAKTSVNQYSVMLLNEFGSHVKTLYFPQGTELSGKIAEFKSALKIETDQDIIKDEEGFLIKKTFVKFVVHIGKKDIPEKLREDLIISPIFKYENLTTTIELNYFSEGETPESTSFKINLKENTLLTREFLIEKITLLNISSYKDNEETYIVVGFEYDNQEIEDYISIPQDKEGKTITITATYATKNLTVEMIPVFDPASNPNLGFPEYDTGGGQEFFVNEVTAKEIYLRFISNPNQDIDFFKTFEYQNETYYFSHLEYEEETNNWVFFNKLELSDPNTPQTFKVRPAYSTTKPEYEKIYLNFFTDDNTLFKEIKWNKYQPFRFLQEDNFAEEQNDVYFITDNIFYDQKMEMEVNKDLRLSLSEDTSFWVKTISKIKVIIKFNKNGEYLEEDTNYIYLKDLKEIEAFGIESVGISKDLISFPKTAPTRDHYYFANRWETEEADLFEEHYIVSTDLDLTDPSKNKQHTIVFNPVYNKNQYTSINYVFNLEGNLKELDTMNVGINLSFKETYSPESSGIEKTITIKSLIDRISNQINGNLFQDKENTFEVSKINYYILDDFSKGSTTLDKNEIGKEIVVMIPESKPYENKLFIEITISLKENSSFARINTFSLPDRPWTFAYNGKIENVIFFTERDWLSKMIFMDSKLKEDYLVAQRKVISDTLDIIENPKIALIGLRRDETNWNNYFATFKLDTPSAVNGVYTARSLAEYSTLNRPFTFDPTTNKGFISFNMDTNDLPPIFQLAIVSNYYSEHINQKGYQVIVIDINDAPFEIEE